MIRRTVLLTFAAGLATIGYSTFLASNQIVLAADENEAVLIKSLSNAKVSLQQGLMASEREGRPISQRSSSTRMRGVKAPKCRRYNSKRKSRLAMYAAGSII